MGARAKQAGKALPAAPSLGLVSQRTSQLRRGLNALELLSRGISSGTEIARELGVNRSTAMRILQELEEAGFVGRPDGRQYEIASARLLRLAAHPGSTDGTEMVQELLASLRDEFGEATVLGAPAHDSMVYVSFFPSRHAVAVREQMGTSRPMHASALGKAYLSALDDEIMEAEIARLSYEGGTVTSAANADELRSRVVHARSRGYALDRDETFEGVSCVAAPARIGGALIGAIGISAPSQRFSATIMEEVSRRLVVEVRALETRHG